MIQSRAVAAAYAIQTISAAVRQIPDAWLTDFPTEPWAQIKRIGDRIRHEYFRLDDAILCKIMTADAPGLETVLETNAQAAYRRSLIAGFAQPQMMIEIQSVAVSKGLLY